MQRFVEHVVWFGGVHAVGDQFEQVPERFLIIHSFIEVGSKFKVHFSEVHTDGLVSELLEEVLNEIEGESILFGGSRGLEALCIDCIDVKRNPVMFVPSLEVSVKFALNLLDVLCLAVGRFEDEHVLLLNELVFLGLV